MNEEKDDIEDLDLEKEEDPAPQQPAFTDKELVKAMSILFVLALYLFIFMKILFIN